MQLQEERPPIKQLIENTQFYSFKEMKYRIEVGGAANCIFIKFESANRKRPIGLYPKCKCVHFLCGLLE
jgi:hypothetical protein